MTGCGEIATPYLLVSDSLKATDGLEFVGSVIPNLRSSYVRRKNIRRAFIGYRNIVPVLNEERVTFDRSLDGRNERHFAFTVNVQKEVFHGYSKKGRCDFHTYLVGITYAAVGFLTTQSLGFFNRQIEAWLQPAQARRPVSSNTSGIVSKT